MSIKKLLSVILAFAMIISIASFSVSAADSLALSADKTTASWGDTVTVKLPMAADNTEKVGAISIELKYDKDKLEFINGYSDFFSGTDGDRWDDTANSQLAVFAGNDMNCVKTQGNLFVANFRVKAEAVGGDTEFAINYILIDDVNSVTLYPDTTSVTAQTINIAAPRQLATPVVTMNASTPKASWTAVENAVSYHVVVKKGDAVIIEKDVTDTEFDFSKFVTETATYKVTVTANKNGATYPASEPSDEAAQEYVVNSTITPSGSKAYVTGSGGIEVVMTLNGNTLQSIDGLNTDDYDVVGNVIKIKDSALTEDKNLTFNFSAGEPAALNITVTKAADAATFVLAERENASYAADDTIANDGSNDGLIVVTNAVNPITNFVAAQFKVENRNDLNYEKVEYEIVPADGFALLYNADTDTYEINVKPVNGVAPSISENNAGEGIVIGKLVRKGTGYGKGTITASNIRVTVEKSDNSYAELEAGGYDFLYDIPEPTEKLHISVDFSKLPTETDNIADYQKMALKLYSPRLGYIDIKLGSELTGYTSDDGKITATVTKADNNYKVEFDGLPKFDGYTLAISGDGYRDAKAQFVLNEETTVNFWNNANDADSIYITKANSGTEKLARKNFLAGDIIMNNVIDLYDLSAVSSYYGKKDLKDDADLNADYIQYDLNRDGQVDIIDITMLLAGWAE